MTEQETDTQRATRSALGGFERDAKTFQGHLDKVIVSAEAFVKRHEKFSKQEPGHERLAETEFLLAEAKRILGQPQVSCAEANAPIWAENDRALGERGQVEAAERVADDERLAGLETAVTALARIALNTRHRDMVADGQADTEDALSYLRNWLGHLAPLPKREPGADAPAEPDGGTAVASMDAQAGVPGYVDAPGATGNFADWNENARPGPLAPGDTVMGRHFNSPAPDPAAGLLQREQERVQAVLDAAASKALANPLAAALAPPAAAVNPFAGWPAPNA